MRVLFLTTPVPSHFTTMVPLAWALRGAGHEVLVAGQPDITPAATAAGLSIAVVGPHYHVTDLMAGMPVGVPAGAVRGSHARPWAMHARYTTTAYLDIARDWGADAIVADRLEYSSLIIGAVLGIPVLHHRYGVDLLADGAWEDGRRMLSIYARHFDLPDIPLPTVVVDPCPASLQVPGLVPAEPLRFVPSNGVGTVPSWVADKWAERRVAVSLGSLTTAVGGVDVVRQIIAAAAGVPDLEVVVTVDAAAQAQLGTVGGPVRLVDPVPLELFMGTCDAVVHHGGAGTTLTSTSYGVPQVVLPQSNAVLPAADRIAACGAGLAVLDSASQADREHRPHRADPGTGRARFPGSRPETQRRDSRRTEPRRLRGAAGAARRGG